jgi:LysM repeat protein
MLGRSYVVVEGDNLWKISKRNLGGGSQWPRIYRYNNRREVIAVTGRGIKNPDLIYVGQRLLLPIVPGAPSTPSRKADPAGLIPAARPVTASRPVGHPSPQPLRQPGPLSHELPKIQSPISLKFRLDDLRLPPIDIGTAIIEYRMSGDVLLRSSKSYPATYVTSRNEIEVQATNELNHAFGKLISDNRFIYDPEKKQVTVRTMMVSQSNTPNVPATAIGLEMSSNSPLPKLRAEIRFPKLEGSIGPVPYVAMDVKFVVEITPKMPPSGPSPQPIRLTEPVHAPSTNWGKVVGAGLIITSGIIVVATIAEDFVCPAGIADDPASFSAAAVAFARGLSMVRGAAAALPAAAPASLSVGTSLQFAH